MLREAAMTNEAHPNDHCYYSITSSSSPPLEAILVLFPTATAANTRLTTLAHPARWACGPDRDADGIADG